MMKPHYMLMAKWELAWFLNWAYLRPVLVRTLLSLLESIVLSHLQPYSVENARYSPQWRGKSQSTVHSVFHIHLSWPHSHKIPYFTPADRRNPKFEEVKFWCLYFEYKEGVTLKNQRTMKFRWNGICRTNMNNLVANRKCYIQDKRHSTDQDTSL